MKWHLRDYMSPQSELAKKYPTSIVAYVGLEACVFQTKLPSGTIDEFLKGRKVRLRPELDFGPRKDELYNYVIYSTDSVGSFERVSYDPAIKEFI